MADILRLSLMVATPLALIAFVGALIFFARRSELSQQQRRLEAVPEAERFKLVEEGFTRYNLSAENFTREQKYDLLVRELDQRHERMARTAKSWLIGFVLLLVFLFAVFYFGSSKPNEAIVPPPVDFETHVTRHSYGLPEEVFGGIQDAARGREWLESLDASARAKYGQDAVPMWLYTAPFGSDHGTFVAHVDVGTQEGMDIQGYRIWTKGKLQRESLDKLDGQGPQTVYRFDVAESHKDDRLLILWNVE